MQEVVMSKAYAVGATFHGAWHLLTCHNGGVSYSV